MRASWSAGAAALLVTSVGVVGCKNDDGSIEQSNSNTSWLAQCTSDAECGSALSCLCGVCTRSCAIESCEDLGGTCAPAGSAPHALQCGDAEPLSLCLRACSAEHAECAPEQACTASGCVPRPVSDPCARAEGALLCSSFEGPDATAIPVVLEGGRIVDSPEQSLFGSRSLAATVAMGSGRSVLHYEFAPQTSGTTLYLRAWLYFDVAETSALHAHALTLGSVNSGNWGTTLHVLDGKLGLSFPIRGDVAGTLPVVPHRWLCVRAQIELASSAGAASVWLDDALSLAATGVDTLPLDDAHNIAVGIDHTTEPDMSLYVDGLWLGTTPIGCTD